MFQHACYIRKSNIIQLLSLYPSPHNISQVPFTYIRPSPLFRPWRTLREIIPNHREQVLCHWHTTTWLSITVVYVNFVRPIRSVGSFPLCVFGGGLESIHGEVEVSHQILKDIFGNLGAYSSSALRHVVCGTRLTRVFVTMLGPP